MPRSNRRVVYEQPVNVDLPVDLVRALDDFVDKTGMKKKEIVELALLKYLNAETKSSTPRSTRL